MKVRCSLKSAKNRDKDCKIVRRKGRIYVIKRLDSGAGTPGDCDLDPNGNLDGATDSKPLHNQESISVQCITGGWIIIGAYLPPGPP